MGQVSVELIHRKRIKSKKNYIIINKKAENINFERNTEDLTLKK